MDSKILLEIVKTLDHLWHKYMTTGDERYLRAYKRALDSIPD